MSKDNERRRMLRIGSNCPTSSPSIINVSPSGDCLFRPRLYYSEAGRSPSALFSHYSFPHTIRYRIRLQLFTSNVHLEISKSLQDDLIGQPLAAKVLLNSLKAHWTTKQPRKALVLSFHGSPGTGKTYVANRIVSSLARLGTASPSLVIILGAAFENGDPSRQKTSLLNKIRTAVEKCSRTLVLIDDADRLGEEVLDSLLPFMEFNDHVNGLDYRKTTFVLISSVGGREVNDVAIERQAVPREQLNLRDFEKKVVNALFNEQGAFHRSQLVSRGVIDVFVPFLPLSRLHVEHCIRDHLRRSGKQEINEGIVFDIASSFQVASRTDTRLIEEHDEL